MYGALETLRRIMIHSGARENEGFIRYFQKWNCNILIYE
jgi:hypothetical protein